jgi:translation elongation factor EF-Ts
MFLFKLKKLYPYYEIFEVSKPTKKLMNLNKSLKLAKELREKTMAGMQTCHNIIKELIQKNDSLTDNQYIEEGINILNKQKQVIASKKSNNETPASIIKYKLGNSDGIIIKFGCQSDEGAKQLKKNEDYSKILDNIINIAYENNIEFIHDLNNCLYEEDNKKQIVQQKLQELSGTLGENIQIIDLETVDTIENVPNTFVSSYIHSDSTELDKAGGLIIYNCKEEHNTGIIRKILHQLVYSNPIVIRKSSLLKSIPKQLEIELKKQIVDENFLYDSLMEKKEKNIELTKGEQILLDKKEVKKTPIDKIEQRARGLLNKSIEEIVFELQPFAFDYDNEFTTKSKKTIKDLLAKYKIEIFDFAIV